jgi:hypothetical protein
VKAMISLFIFLVLCFKGIKLASVRTLIIRIWASWSDRPLTMGDVEDELNLHYPQKLLYFSNFEFLLRHLQYVTNYMALIMSLSFSVVLIETIYVYVPTDYKLRVWVAQIF